MRILILEALNDWFHPKPLEAQIQEEMEHQLEQARHAERTINNHRYLRHMALSQIEAMNNWVNDVNIRGD